MPESLTEETVEPEPLPRSEETEELEECRACGNEDSRQCQCADCEQCAYLCRCINCEECAESCDCVVCDNCSERVSEYDCDTCRYCERCIQNGRVDHYTCDGCGECVDPGSTTYCGHCYYAECCRTFTGGCEHGYCTRCCDSDCECEANDASEETCNHIHSYSSHRYPPANPAPDTVPASFLYLGVELETECAKGASRKIASDTIHEQYAHRILQKEDGSLTNGIELVTGKLGLAEHQKLWPLVCQTAATVGLRSWNHTTTGLHVHLSRAHFSSLDIGKLVCFINSSDLLIRSNLKKLAGRSSNGYSEIKTKKISCAHRCCESRYEAVNLTNDATVEIRIFKGTLKADHVLADIEFCHALAGYVKNISIAELESWPNFLTYARTQSKQYKHFLQFMAPHAIEFSDSTQPTTAEE